MFTKFYDNTIITKFVKELVAKTNVPFISTWKPGDFAIRGMLYLTRDAIWRCLHTGWPKAISDKCPEEHASSVSGQYSDEELRFFVRVSPYVFGEEYYNITGRYESKILGYDSTTHLYLGQYLRMMRDIYDLDLMPFYNCFGNDYAADIDFTPDGKVFSASSADSIYKILSVPVHFGKTYMISINSDIPIECICAIYGSKGIIKDLTDNLNNIDSDNYSTYKKFQRTLFEAPVLYKTVDWHQLYSQFKDSDQDGLNDDDSAVINDQAYDLRLGQYEKYLRLLIKVPKSNKSSIVIIEGDYPVIEVEGSTNTTAVTWSNQYLKDTTINSKTVTGDWIRPEVILNFKPDIDPDSSWSYRYNKLSLFSPLSLLLMSDGNIYAFSDRLIEYLVLNAINHLDTFTKDIARVLEYSKSEINLLKNGSRYEGAIVPGVWDKDFQEYLFNLTKNSKLLTRKIDLTGNVDKDTESVITRGQKI